MAFGIEKCAKATFKRGKLINAENTQLDLNSTIQDLEQDGSYKYHGINEGDGIEHAKMKRKYEQNTTGAYD